MASTYSQNLKIELIGTGEQSGVWGTTTNTNLGTALEQAIVGYGNPNFASDADLTISLSDSNATQTARNFSLRVTSGVSLTTTRNLIVPTIQKPYLIFNDTTGGQSIVVKTSAGSGVTVPNGRRVSVYANGTDVVLAQDYLGSGVEAVTQAFGTSNTTVATTAFVQAALAAMYPVGSIYTNATNATNPGTLLGFGTWTAFGAGRVMVGFNGSDPLFDSAEETGGSKDAIVVSHTHTATVTDPGHVHSFSAVQQIGGSYLAFSNTGQQAVTNTASATTGITVSNSTTGSSGTNANLQPYITVYMWKRTA
jgi:hypothetical protein